MSKLNKIIVVAEMDDKQRITKLQQEVVNRGLAMTRSDAAKLIRRTPHDFNLQQCYYVAAELYNLRSHSTSTTYRLVEMAARGILVIIGAKRVPPEMELFCEVV